MGCEACCQKYFCRKFLNILYSHILISLEKERHTFEGKVKQNTTKSQFSEAESYTKMCSKRFLYTRF